MFTDSHAHVTSNEFLGEEREILQRAWENNVRNILNICTNLETLEKGLNLSKEYPWLYQAAAVHPHDANEQSDPYFLMLTQEAKSGRLKAIGETGLDYYYHHASPESQKIYLRKHLSLALECKLPIIIHCREAFNDLFEELDSFYSNNLHYAPGVLHCFTGSQEEAKKILDKGWYISISGIVTFKKSIELQEVAKLVPLDRLLIETDAPFLAPQSHRGKRNEPSFLPETAQKIADLKNISIDELAEATTRNVQQLFHF